MALPLALIPALLTVLLPALGPDGDGCRRCDKRGVVPCDKHSEEEHAYEVDVQFCSVAAACKACAGALLIDCKRCKGGPDDELIPTRQAAVKAWMAEQPMAEFLERPVPVAETKHFKLIIDTGTLKEGRKKVDQHLIMHRVARDVEEVARLIGEHYVLQGSEAMAAANAAKPEEEEDFPDSWTEPETPKPDYKAKMRMWIWNKPADHKKVMHKFLHSASTGDFKMLGKTPVFSVWTEDSFDTVPGVRRLFTHNASHMLLSNLYKEMWTGDQGGGWMDAGSAHWYEYKIHELSLNYCIEEATARLNFHNGVWRAPIRRQLQKQSKRQLPRLMDMNTGAMSLPEQAICWSLYDWLVANHVQAIPKILQGLKQRVPSRDLLREHLGMSVLKIEDEWREWVEATYPLKGDVPRTPKRR
ncbi:MAG: hypothetical protein ACI8QC_002824 [Planctomycetota bacterium]|jgi:hypothetical protein